MMQRSSIASLRGYAVADWPTLSMLWLCCAVCSCHHSTTKTGQTSPSITSGGSTSPTTAGPNQIPVTLNTISGGYRIATVQVSVGGSAPFTATLDTGSYGLRVVPGFVPDSAWTKTSHTISGVFGGSVAVSGDIYQGVVEVGGMSTGTAIPVELITTVGCSASAPDCGAAGESASDYRFQGEYPADLGIGLRPGEVASPLATLGVDHRFILSLPEDGATTSGLIQIDPTADQIVNFTTDLALPQATANSANGLPGWEDNAVPFCMNSFCSTGIMDTGGKQFHIIVPDATAASELGVGYGATQVPSGTSITVALDKTASWSFTVSANPVEGTDLITIGSNTSVSNLGISAFFKFDMLYNYETGHIGFAKK